MELAVGVLSDATSIEPCMSVDEARNESAFPPVILV